MDFSFVKILFVINIISMVMASNSKRFLLNNTESSVDRITRLENTVALLNNNLLQLMSKFEQQNRHIQTLENSHGMYKSLPSPWVKVAKFIGITGNVSVTVTFRLVNC